MRVGNDGAPTPTSQLQSKTEDVLNAHANQPLTLHRQTHLTWISRCLLQGFPERYTGLDASQPWLVYWLLQTATTLGASLDAKTRSRAVETLLACQHSTGGFGGGPRQEPHLLPTYAAVSALALTGDREAWERIDRERLYEFLLTVKQPSGQFIVSRVGEADVRGTYCALVVATLLDLLTPELAQNVPRAIAGCQTYEGGFAASTDETRYVPLGEAHGGYTFCALAAWRLIAPFCTTIDNINMRTLKRWLTGLQGENAELRGFRGRTNKLVDACYAWWVGGAFALLDDPPDGDEKQSLHLPVHSDNDEGWVDVEDSQSIFDKEGLQEYLLRAAQYPPGGLRDKPPKPADAYHTLYATSGLSAAQHQVKQRLTENLEPQWIPSSSADGENRPWRRAAWLLVQSWTEQPKGANFVGGSQNRVNATHPLFVMTISHVRAMMNYFYRQDTS